MAKAPVSRQIGKVLTGTKRWTIFRQPGRCPLWQLCRFLPVKAVNIIFEIMLKALPTFAFAVFIFTAFTVESAFPQRRKHPCPRGQVGTGIERIGIISRGELRTRAEGNSHRTAIEKVAVSKQSRHGES
jgi:hypothetical protein